MNKDLYPIYKTNDNNSARFLLGTRGNKTLVFCGINPSTATKEKSDRTITKVNNFAKFNGYDSFLMINLYAQRTPYPYELPNQMSMLLHRENIKILRSHFNRMSKVDFVACWGNNISIREYLFNCFCEVRMILESYGRNIYQLGETTLNGNPRHPSRLPYETKMRRFNLQNYFTHISR